MTNPDSIVIFSGGLDSTVLLYKVIKQEKKNPIALTIDYGQRHSKEVEAAKVITKKLGIEHKIVKVNFFKNLTSSALIDDKKKMPHEHYTHSNQKITVVPNRNMVMLAIAGAIAEDKGIKHLYYGAHANDHAIYPDCRPDFVNKMREALLSSTYVRVELHAPFVNLTKAEIVGIGKLLSVPFNLTWSCYEGKDKPCEKCATCQERIEAFRANGAIDPLS